MKTITKTDWNQTHTDARKFQNGQHFIQGIDFTYTNGRLNTIWIPVKIKGVKNGVRY